MVTIIFSDAQDNDCELILRKLEEIPNTFIRRFIHITPDNDVDEEDINSAIAEETDTLLLIGHGTWNGLLGPKRNGEYIIHQYNACAIAAKYVVCIWCYAVDFARKYIKNATIAATGMFISNPDEARDNGIDDTVSNIDDACNKFYAKIFAVIFCADAIEDYYRISKYPTESPVDQFNKGNCRILLAM